MKSRLLLALLLAVLGVFLILQYDGSEPGTTPSTPTAAAPTTSSTTETQPSAAKPTTDTDGLPREALETIALIQSDGPFPYRQDGAVFMNRERRLPARERGYWREYTVETPGESDRGARRIVHGAGDEYFYTDDHYDSFRRIHPGKLVK